MNDKTIVRFLDEDLMYEEKIDILVGEHCKSIFPISIVHEDKGLTGLYCTYGYRRLSQLGNLTAISALVIAQNIILAIEECYQYLMFPEEYIINTNTTYVNCNNYIVKFTYLPDKRRESLSKKYNNILMELRRVTTENDSVYLDRLIEHISQETVSFNKIKLVISRLLQEASNYNLL